MFIAPPPLNEPVVRRTLLQCLRLRPAAERGAEDDRKTPAENLPAARALTFVRCALYRPRPDRRRRRVYDGRKRR